jgi:hypothetical protein
MMGLESNIIEDERGLYYVMYKLVFYDSTILKIGMGLAGFEPTVPSARGWYLTKLDHNPFFDFLFKN